MTAPVCILNKCPHAKTRRCDLLGECGAGYALTRAREIGGFQMIYSNNLTREALEDAGLVKEVAFNGNTITVSATQ